MLRLLLFNIPKVSLRENMIFGLSAYITRFCDKMQIV